MEEKYTKFCKTFHKKLKNDKNLILCSNSLSDREVEFGIAKEFLCEDCSHEWNA